MTNNNALGISNLHKTEVGLPEKKYCIVCFEYEASAVMLPCLHGGLCEECAGDILSKSNRCIICRNVSEDNNIIRKSVQFLRLVV